MLPPGATGADVPPPWLEDGDWDSGISFTGASVGGIRPSGGIVGLPNALLQKAGHALAT